MSEVLPESEALADSTSVSASDETAQDEERQGILSSMTIYDTLLVLSFVFVVLASLRLFVELRVYSPGFPFGGLPWKASEYQFLMWF